MGIPSASISWLMLKILLCPSRRLCEPSPASWPNPKSQIPAITYRGHCISGMAKPSANGTTPQPCAVCERRSRPLCDGVCWVNSISLWKKENKNHQLQAYQTLGKWRWEHHQESFESCSSPPSLQQNNQLKAHRQHRPTCNDPWWDWLVQMHLNEDRKRCKQNDKENVVDNIYLTSSQSTLEALFAEVQGETRGGALVRVQIIRRQYC